MRILVITQKVDINDDVLGFFHHWIEEFANRCEKITVICLYKGEHNLPENVKVLSLGKPAQVWPASGREKLLGRIKTLVRFYGYIWQERGNYNSVLVHMNPEYVVLGGLFWKLWGKKIALWYTHKAVNWKLKLAERLVDKIFTASEESFRLASKKVEVTGHGIDVKKFQIPSTKSQINLKSSNSNFTIITVGRIAPVKNIDVLIEVAAILRNKGLNFNIKIAGAPALESDKIYFEKIKESIKDKKLENKIKFIGPIPNKDIAQFYQSGDLFVNFSDTDSLDKAVLEAMASGLEVLTSNKAFAGIVPAKNFTSKNSQEIAEKIIALSKLAPDGDLMRNYIEQNHNLDNLIGKIINFYE